MTASPDKPPGRMTAPTVEVSAVGRARCTPDRVLIHLAVEVTRPTVAEALREVSAVLTRLLGLLDAEGIVGPDRQTSGLSVEQPWGGEGQPSGHRATYRLALVVGDLDSAGLLVQRAGEAVGDALRVHGFQLSAADTVPQQEQARRAAVAACRAQAEQLADAAGATLGELVRLVEGAAHGAIMRLESGGSRGGGMPVEAGELEVAVGVTGMWALLV